MESGKNPRGEVQRFADHVVDVFQRHPHPEGEKALYRELRGELPDIPRLALEAVFLESVFSEVIENLDFTDDMRNWVRRFDEGKVEVRRFKEFGDYVFFETLGVYLEKAILSILVDLEGRLPTRGADQVVESISERVLCLMRDLLHFPDGLSHKTVVLSASFNGGLQFACLTMLKLAAAIPRMFVYENRNDRSVETMLATARNSLPFLMRLASLHLPAVAEHVNMSLSYNTGSFSLSRRRDSPYNLNNFVLMKRANGQGLSFDFKDFAAFLRRARDEFHDTEARGICPAAIPIVNAKASCPQGNDVGQSKNVDLITKLWDRFVFHLETLYVLLYGPGGGFAENYGLSSHESELLASSPAFHEIDRKC